MENEYLKKNEFVKELSKVLNMAKPHLTCEYKLGEELPMQTEYIMEKLSDSMARYTPVTYQPDGEWVVVNCDNGYKYYIPVTGDSLAAIAEEVFRKMVFK